MKVQLTRDKFIKVTAETVVEAYALNHLIAIKGCDESSPDNLLMIDTSVLMEPDTKKGVCQCE